MTNTIARVTRAGDRTRTGDVQLGSCSGLTHLSDLRPRFGLWKSRIALTVRIKPDRKPVSVDPAVDPRPLY